MIALVEGAARQKTPNEIALTILLTTLTIIFVLAVMAIQPLAVYSGQEQSVVVLVALLVCLIPTTIGALLSAIGIAGMDRLVQHNVLAMSGRAVEAAGDVSTLLLDKTGTITFGNRRATELLAAPGLGDSEVTEAAYLSSLADETPEGRSIVELAAADLSDETRSRFDDVRRQGATFVEFTAQTRMSGVDLPDGTAVRKARPTPSAAGSPTTAVTCRRSPDRSQRHRERRRHTPRRRVRAGRRAAARARGRAPQGRRQAGMKERFAQLRPWASAPS